MNRGNFQKLTNYSMKYTDPSLENFIGAKYTHLIDITFGLDLTVADMPPTNKYNKWDLVFVVCYCVYNNYVWVVP